MHEATQRTKATRNTTRTCFCYTVLAVAIASYLPAGMASAQTAAAETAVQFDIPAGDLASALERFSTQTGIQLLYRNDLVVGKRSKGVSGRHNADEALRLVLAGTDLVWDSTNATTFVIREATPSQARSPSTSRRDPASSDDERIVGMPAIMVQGARTLNMDIERTVDDPQPYVVFSREDIERSGSINLNDFLMTRLPMNAAGRATMQGQVGLGNTSVVALRGLSENQTLILIDGRRLANTTVGLVSGQPDINGIPLEAIERIEILPTTASAIYGGSATGGVINVILRREYMGTQVGITYDNSFDTDSAIKRVNLSSGFSLFGGRTSVLLTGSYTESNALLVKDRDFVQRGRRNILANNPAYLGSPPSSTSTNIRSASGADLVLDDGTPIGSYFTHVPPDYAGFASDNGASLLTNAGSYNEMLGQSASQSGAASAGGGFSITGGGPSIKYFSGSVRHDFSDRLKGFLDASRSENNTRQGGRGVNLPGANIPAAAPSNPFQQPIRVGWTTQQLEGYIESESEYTRYSSGLVFQVSENWTSAIDYTLSRSEFSRRDTSPYFGSASAFYADIANGRIDVLRDFDSQGLDAGQYLVSNFNSFQTPLRVTTRNPAIRLSGPIGSLKAGRPSLSLLLERQDTDFGSSTHVLNGGQSLDLYPDRSRKIDSAYVELRVPLLSLANGLAWVDELELQVAARWDKYSSVNAARLRLSGAAATQPPPPFAYVTSAEEQLSPLVAVKFRPNDSWAFRASYGTGFLPPDINQQTQPTVYPAFNASLLGATDPKRGNTLVTGDIEYSEGGNPGLESEKSKTWSVGAIFTPVSVENLRFSMDYTKIEKDNAIIYPGSEVVLTYEELFPGKVTRSSNLPGDPAGWAGPIAALDLTMVNLAKVEVEAFDFKFDYTQHTARWGAFSLFAMATLQTKLDLQVSPSAPIVDSLGWQNGNINPMKIKANLGLEWNLNAWALGWTARYMDSYLVDDPSLTVGTARSIAQGNGGRIPSQTYHDIFGRYRFGRVDASSRGVLAGLADGLEVRGGIRNLFNSIPPFDVTSFYYYYSGLGDPRLRTYYISLHKSF